MRSVLIVGVMCCSMSGLSAADLFLRGDVDGSGARNVSDAVVLLGHLFSGGEIPCEDAADTDDSGSLSITDPIYLLNYLFSSGIAPPFPLTHCSVDLTTDFLSCDRFEYCEPEAEFFGQPYAGDVFVFVVDHSGSALGRELVRTTSEIDKFVATLSDSSEVAVVVFDANLRRFPSDGVPFVATEENRLALTAWLEATPRGSGSCMRLGIEEGLRMAEASEAPRRTLIYIGDGGGTCRGSNEQQYLNEMLRAADETNTVDAQINAIGVLMGQGRLLQQDVLRALSRRHGGTYVRID